MPYFHCGPIVDNKIAKFEFVYFHVLYGVSIVSFGEVLLWDEISLICFCFVDVVFVVIVFLYKLMIGTIW